MKPCSNKDCPTKGRELPESAFYGYYNKAKERWVWSSYCKACERERQGKKVIKPKKSYSRELDKDQSTFNEVMKISLRTHWKRISHSNET